MRRKFSGLSVQRLGKIIAIMNLSFLLFCCVLFQTSYPEYDTAHSGQLGVLRHKESDLRYIEEKFGSLEKMQQLLRENAYALVGAKSLTARGKRYNFDCVGVVLATYHLSGVDLSPALTRYSGNGVSRLFKSLDEQGLLYETKTPHTGDLIFWDNTYDRNNDGKWNDYLTHIGMVVNTDEQGNIEYIHYNYRKGIVLEKMNLFKPDVHLEKAGDQYREINSPMRMQGSGQRDRNRWLSSQLCRIFGLAYLSREIH